MATSPAFIRAEVEEIELLMTVGEVFHEETGVQFALGSIPKLQGGPAGQVVAIGTLAGDGVSAEDDQALVLLAPGGSGEVLLREGDVFRDSAGEALQVSRITEAFLDRDGNVAVWVDFKNEGGVKVTGLLHGAGPSLELAAYVGLEVWGARLQAPSSPVLTPGGRLLYQAGLSVSTNALWSGRPGDATLVVAEATHYPGMPAGGSFKSLPSYFVHTDAGDILFNATTSWTGGDGLWRYRGGEMAPVWTRADGAPELPGLSATFFPAGPWLADDGWAAFQVTLSGTGVGSTNNRALYVADGDTVGLVARGASPAPGTDGAVFGNGFTVYGVARGGRMLFENQLRPASGETPYPYSLWLWQGGSLRELAEMGRPVTAAESQEVLAFRGAAVSPSGRVAFGTWLDQPNSYAVWVVDGSGAPRRVLGTGDAMPTADGGVATVGRVEVVETIGEPQFDERGRFLAWLVPEGEVRRSLAWVDPGKLLPDPEGISGTVFQDTDASGGFTAADRGLPGVRVRLFQDDGVGNPTGALIAAQETDPAGHFEFRSLPPGDYVLSTVNLPGYESVADTGGANDDLIFVTLQAGVPAAGNDFLDRLAPVPTQVEITLHRVEPDAVVNLEAGRQAIDQPLLPVAAPDRLRRLPRVSQGLVADGVTPLIVRVGFLPGELRVSRPIRLRIAGVEGGEVAGGLGDHWRRLYEDWSNSADDQLVDAHHPEAYALLTAIPMHQLTFASGSVELAVSVSVEDVVTGGVLQNRTVYLRRPPIALVHGYNTAGDWGVEFREVLNGSRPWEEPDPPDNFVRTIRYGQFKPWSSATRKVWALDALTSGRFDLAGTILNHENTLLRLDELVPKLHAALEEQMAPLRNHWAFTRHDVIAHSQGGLLTRMLASGRGRTGSHPPFRSVSSFYRGRFHRVITVGSPHNGSRLLGYMLRLAEAPHVGSLSMAIPRAIASAAISSGKAQDKFDPWGEQIRALNDPSPTNPWTPDPEARFHLVRTTIARGRAPDASDTTPIAIVFRLNSPNGAQVLPRGSDGIVDFDSMVGGTPGGPPPPNSFTLPPGVVISHSGPTPLFTEKGGPEAIGQTASPDVALHAREMLDAASATAFGPFPVPVLLAPSAEQALRDVATPGFLADMTRSWTQPLIDGIRRQITASHSLAGPRRAGGPATVYTYHLEAASRAPGSEVSWFAEVSGPDGVSSGAVEIVPVSQEPPTIDLVVPDSVLGDVVLFAHCLLADGRGVWMRPENVVSRLPEGATPSDVAVISPAGDYPPGEYLSPWILVRYTDGTVLLRHAAVAGLEAVSSAPDVVDVSDPLLWVTRGPGEAMVTVSVLGMTATSELTVRPEGPVLEGLRIASWARGDGTFEVTVPVWDDSELTLWRAADLGDPDWAPVPGATVTPAGPEAMTLGDPDAGPGPAFYRVTAGGP